MKLVLPTGVKSDYIVFLYDLKRGKFSVELWKAKSILFNPFSSPREIALERT